MPMVRDCGKIYGCKVLYAGLNEHILISQKMKGKMSMEPLQGGCSMKMQDVRTLGRKNGLRFGVGMTKVAAIRAIQSSEGNFDCFARAGSGYCDQVNCLFRTECLVLSQQSQTIDQTGRKGKKCRDEVPAQEVCAPEQGKEHQ